MSIAEKLTIIAENQRDVYNAGFTAGQAQGGGGSYDEGYAQAQQDEYDRFWDIYQSKGIRVDYMNAFAGSGWNDETFKPKYNMTPTTAYMMFRSTGITDLRAETIGVVIDFSNCTDFSYCFPYTSLRLKYLPLIDITKAKNLTNAFDSYGGTDLSLVVSENSAFHNKTFYSAINLTNLSIEGTIGKSIDLQSCSLLSEASVQNIIDCLKDLTGATAQTLTFHATVSGNLTQEQKDAISAKNWTLVSSK